MMDFVASAAFMVVIIAAIIWNDRAIKALRRSVLENFTGEMDNRATWHVQVSLAVLCLASISFVLFLIIRSFT